METRKLQQVGGGTYTVSIPKSWAENHGVEAGTNVHLYTHADGSIVLRNSEQDAGPLAEIHIDVHGTGRAHVRRALRAAHAIGFESVTLRPETRFTDEQLREANLTKRSLVGAELVVERDDEITVRNMLDASDVSVRQTVVQLNFIARSVHREATTAFVEADDDAVRRVRDRIGEADRLLTMVTRHVNRALVSFAEIDRLGTSRPTLFDAYATAHELDHLATRGGSIARLACDLPAPLPDREAAAFQRAAQQIRDAVDAATTSVLEGKDPSAAFHALDRRDDALETVESTATTLLDDSSAVAARRRAVEHLRQSAAHAGTIATVGLRASLRPDAS